MEFILFKAILLVICLFFTGWEVFKLIDCLDNKKNYNAIGWVFISMLWGLFYFVLNIPKP